MADPPELEDAEFVTLCARYLNLKFDLTDEPTENDQEDFSSPCSCDTDDGATRISNQSASTARTTPLRPIPRVVEEQEFTTISTYLQHLAYADLPPASKRAFESLAYSIQEIASLLLSNNRLDMDIASAVIAHGGAIARQVQHSILRVKEQLSNVAFIKRLAPFEVLPASFDLWCNYRQKAQLIVQ